MKIRAFLIIPLFILALAIPFILSISQANKINALPAADTTENLDYPDSITTQSQYNIREIPYIHDGNCNDYHPFNSELNEAGDILFGDSVWLNETPIGLDFCAIDFNDAGQIIGYRRNDNYPYPDTRTYLYWEDGITQEMDIGPIGITRSGQVGGNKGIEDCYVAGGEGPFSYAVAAKWTWADGTPILLVDGIDEENCLGVSQLTMNDMGTIIGRGANGNWFLWRGGDDFAYYAQLGDSYTRDMINNAGQTAGYFSGGIHVDGASVGEGNILDFNDLGQILGSDETGLFFWDGSKKYLGTLGGAESWASDLNNVGQVIGSSQTSSGETHGFIWENGIMQDLNDLIPPNSGWILRNAVNINDAGQINGDGYLYGENERYLLSIVQPPEQVALGSWEVVTSPTTSRLLGIDIVSEDNIYAVGGAYFNNQSPIVLHYNGLDWSINDTFNSDNQHFTAVSFSDSSNGWAVGYQTLSQYNSGIWSHQATYTVFLYGIEMLSANSGIATGFYYDLSSGLTQYGSIQTYNGSSWQETSTRLEEDYMDVDMLNADEGWIVGSQNGAVVFSDNLAVPHDSAALGGIILHRSSAVPNWTSVHTTSEVLYGVAAVSSNEAWAVGNNGTILHYDGGLWRSVTSPVAAHLKEIVMLSATEGWIVGNGGTILHYENGSWHSVASPVTTDLLDISVLPSGEAWVVGDDGAILHYLPPATLTINYDTGAPGSYFTLVGSGFPANDTATITLNGRTLGTVPTDANGDFTFLLNSSGANEGAYMVTATVNPSASQWFTLDAAAPTRPQEGTGPTFAIPAGIAFDEFVYLPTIIK